MATVDGHHRRTKTRGVMASCEFGNTAERLCIRDTRHAGGNHEVVAAVFALAAQTVTYVPSCRMEEPDCLEQPLQHNYQVVVSPNMRQLVSQYAHPLLPTDSRCQRPRQENQRTHQSYDRRDRDMLAIGHRRCETEAEQFRLPLDELTDVILTNPLRPTDNPPSASEAQQQCKLMSSTPLR